MQRETAIPRARIRKLLAAALAAGFAASAPVARALPTDPVVVNGTASFTQTGNVLTVTNSHGAIIDWQSFGVAAGETAHFLQSSASSAVLNRVLSNNPSEIYGTLSSNGQVWLINPAGILVGAGAVVDTAGFVASTLAVRAEDFLAGRLDFQATSGAGDVVNLGSITTPLGGFVYLVGANVANEGLIATPGGETLLAAGATVSLIDTATPGVKVEITGDANNATNLGEIVAAAGRIGIAGGLVRNAGTLDASSVVSAGGRVFLKASQDTHVEGDARILATGATGGAVEVLGNRVAVTDNALIDVSGANGGGTIKVGGDYQGQNPDVQNAWITYFGPQATLKANATEVGAGGTVIVWADDTTRAYGAIEAKGGPGGGDGGFVETSGKRYLDVNGIRVDTSAPGGTWGSWLIDPDELTIVYSGASVNIAPSAGSFTTAADASATLSWQTIEAALTGNLTVTTSYGGDIVFQQSASDPVWSTANTGNLTFSTTGQIRGNWGGSSGSQPTTGLRLLTVGDITFSGDDGVFLGNGKVETTGGAITVTSADGSIGIGHLKAPGTVTVNAHYSIFDDNWQSTGTAGINVESNNAILLTSTNGVDPGCSNCMAISVDTAGNPTYLSATVTTGTGGGIRIDHQGDAPGEVDLIDLSSSPADNDIIFSATGDIVGLNNTSVFQVGGSGGIIEIIAGGNLTTGMSFLGNPSEIVLYAGNALNINDVLTTTTTATDDPGIYLGAGGTLNVNANLTSSANIGLVAGISYSTWDKLEDMPTPEEASQTPLSTSGQLNVSSTVVATGKVGMIAPVIDITEDGSVQSDDKLYAYTSTDMTLTNGAFMEADFGVYLAFGGGSSTLYLNETGGYAPAYILGNTDGTESTAVHLDFLARSSGGVVIDGVETFTSMANGSGFFNTSHGTPAVLGSTLLVSYGVADAITAAVTNEVANSTEPTTTTEGALPLTTTGDELATAPTEQTTGGGTDEFGGTAEDNDGEGDEGQADGGSGQESDEDAAAAKKAAQCRS